MLVTQWGVWGVPETPSIVEGGVPENFENFSQLFLFIFKHGLNHPKMKRNFFPKVGMDRWMAQAICNRNSLRLGWKRGLERERKISKGVLKHPW